MPNYRVKEGQHVTHDGAAYKEGSIVELTAKQAAAMPWAVEAAPASKKADDGKGDGK